MIMGNDGNNYADAMKNQMQEDANYAQNNMLANTDARAAASGMSGGSRHGIVQAKGMDDINTNLQRNLTEVGFQTFDKDLDRKLAIAGMADSNTLQRQGMLSGMINDQQSTADQAIQGGQDMQAMNMGQYAPQMMPWEAMDAYGNAIGAPTVLASGKSSGSGSSGSVGFGF